MRKLMVSVGCAIALARAVPAVAQMTPTGSRVEASGLLSIVGPTTFDTVASAAAPASGSAVSSLNTTSRIDPGFGAGAAVAVHLGGSIWAAAEVDFSRTSVETRSTASASNPAPVIMTTGGSQLAGLGLVEWDLPPSGAVQPFLGGGAGHMHQATDDGSGTAGGLIWEAGGGVKYWWHSRVGVRPLGLRILVDAVGRSGGLTIGPRGTHVSPAVTLGAVWAF